MRGMSRRARLAVVSVLVGVAASSAGCAGDVAGADAAPSDLVIRADLAVSIDQAMLDQATPPDLAMPDLAMPDLVMPDFAMPDFVMPDFAMPDFAMPDFAMPDLAKPDLTMPDLAMPDLAMLPKGLDFEIGKGPAVPQSTQMVLADFDGDGRSDLFVVDLNDPNDTLAFADGKGSFMTPLTLPLGIKGVRVGDFDGDGKADIASSDSTTGNLAVRIGKGDGTFLAPITTATAAGYSYGITGDVNGDGKLDAIVQNFRQGAPSFSIMTLLGDGKGGFAAASTTNIPVTLGYFALGDVDGDGKVDLAMVYEQANNFTPALKVLPGNRDGTWQAPVSAALPGVTSSLGIYSILLRDTDGDAKADVFVGDRNAVSLFLSTGGGAVQPKTLVKGVTGVAGSRFALGDWNGDGKVDLAIANGSQDYTISTYHGDGTGLFNASRVYDGDFVPSNITSGDVDGDGRADLVYLTNRAIALRGRGDGSFHSLPLSFVAGITPNAPRVADLNGDGRADIVVPERSGAGFWVYLSIAGGTVDAGRLVATAQKSFDVALGDFNEDGKVDALAANAGVNMAQFFAGRGDGTFAAGVQVAAGPFNPVVVDLNGDGHLDIASTAANLQISLGNGDGTFKPPSNYGANRQLQGLAPADYNGDGKLDFAGPDSHNLDAVHQLTVYLSLGNGTFDAGKDYATVKQPYSIAGGDFDGDGKPDVVVASYADNSLNFYHGNGDGTLQAAALLMSPSYYQTTLVAADFDLDGKRDLAIVGNGGFSVLVQGQNGLQLPAAGYYYMGSMRSAAGGDLDGDGKTDLAAIHFIPTTTYVGPIINLSR